MKKILALLLAVVMVLSLAACGKKEADVDDEPVVELTHFEKSQKIYGEVLGDFLAAELFLLGCTHGNLILSFALMDWLWNEFTQTTVL